MALTYTIALLFFLPSLESKTIFNTTSIPQTPGSAGVYLGYHLEQEVTVPIVMSARILLCKDLVFTSGKILTLHATFAVPNCGIFFQLYRRLSLPDKSIEAHMLVYQKFAMATTSFNLTIDVSADNVRAQYGDHLAYFNYDCDQSAIAVAIDPTLTSPSSTLFYKLQNGEKQCSVGNVVYFDRMHLPYAPAIGVTYSPDDLTRQGLNITRARRPSVPVPVPCYDLTLDGVNVAMDGANSSVDCPILANGGCQYLMDSTSDGPRCLCPIGLQLAPDQRTCIDISECAENNGGCGEKQCYELFGGHLCFDSQQGLLPETVEQPDDNSEGSSLIKALEGTLRKRELIVGMLVWLAFVSLILFFVILILCVILCRNRTGSQMTADTLLSGAPSPRD